jgi:hypothetical protein
MPSVTIVKNEEFPIQWNFKVDSSTLKDLTGYSVLVQLRAFKESTTILASYDQNSPYITFTPLQGSVLLTLPPSVTEAFAFKKAVIDCLVYTSVDGDRAPTYDVVIDWGVSRPNG